jgi:hypothetical protein
VDGHRVRDATPRAPALGTGGHDVAKCREGPVQPGRVPGDGASPVASRCGAFTDAMERLKIERKASCRTYSGVRTGGYSVSATGLEGPVVASEWMII